MRAQGASLSKGRSLRSSGPSTPQFWGPRAAIQSLAVFSDRPQSLLVLLLLLWCAAAAAAVALGASTGSPFHVFSSFLARLHAGRERDRAAMAEFRLSKFAI